MLPLAYSVPYTATRGKHLECAMARFLISFLFGYKRYRQRSSAYAGLQSDFHQSHLSVIDSIGRPSPYH